MLILSYALSSTLADDIPSPVLIRLTDRQLTEEVLSDPATLIEKALCPDRPFVEPLDPVPLDTFRRFYSRGGLRLTLTSERLRQIQQQATKDPHLQRQVAALEAAADKLLEAEIPRCSPLDAGWEQAPAERIAQVQQAAADLNAMRRTCALAFALAGEDRYAERAWGCLREGIRHFYTFGVLRMPFSWQSPWDEGLELYDAAETYDLIAHWEGLRPPDHALVFTYLRRLGTRIAYAVELSPVIGADQAMWTCNLGCLTLYAPEIPEAVRWSRLVEERLHSVMSDFMRDGGQIECDPERQAFALTHLLRYARLAARNGDDRLLRAQWGDYDATLIGIADWLAKIATPLGHVPAINDSRPVPLASCEGLLTAADTFRRGDWLRAGHVSPAAVSFLTPIAAHIAPRDPEGRSLLLPDTGFAILRDGWGETDNYLLLDYGRHGGPRGHLDKLSFVMYAAGQPWVLDAGPAPDPLANRSEQESWHRQTVAHNTVLADGQSQEPTDGRLVSWFTHPKFDIAAAEHDGYARLLHRRTVFHPRGGYFLVFDELVNSTEQAHDLEWLVHVNGRRESGTVGRLAFWREGGFGLSVVPARQRGIRGVTVEEGLCTGSDGLSATVLAKQTPGPWTPGEPGWAFIPFARIKLPLPALQTRTFCVALVPFKDREPETTVDVLDTPLAYVVELRTGMIRDRWLLRRQGAEEGMARGLGLATDGRYAFVREEAGKVTVLEVVEGNSLSVN